MGKGKPLCSNDFNATTESRFWAKVEKRGADDCWVFRGGINNKGYGTFHIGGPDSSPWTCREQKAHRVSWCLANPGASTEDSLVLHACDNPPCCNPAHLSLGTDLENVAQMVERERGASGEKNGNTVYTDKFIAAAILRVWDGESRRGVARSIGVSISAVNGWVSGRNRKLARMEAMLCIN
jgi:hypothetical protein